MYKLILLCLLLFVGCAKNQPKPSSELSFDSSKAVACSEEYIPLITLRNPKFEKEIITNKVKFQYDLTTLGKPINIKYTSSLPIPKNIVRELIKTFSRWVLKPAAIDGKVVEQTNCEFKIYEYLSNNLIE